MLRRGAAAADYEYWYVSSGVNGIAIIDRGLRLLIYHVDFELSEYANKVINKRLGFFLAFNQG